MNNTKWPLLVLLIVAASCTEEGESLKLGTFNFYRNPVMQQNLPDPTVIKVDSIWFAFASESGTAIVPTLMSKDLIKWTELDPVFTDKAKPSFISDGTVESPEVAFVGGKYVLYYSLANSSQASGIGAATSDSPIGPWKDNGPVITAESLDAKGIANPSFISDEGNNYLVFGSFNGLYLILLSGDGLAMDGSMSPTLLANDVFDAPVIARQDGQYYLFASVGVDEGEAGCPCILAVGRSESISGPFITKDLSSMADGAYEVVIASSTKFQGPGHCSGMQMDSEGGCWMLYNAYDLSDVSLGRTLMLDKVNWKDGWPVVRGSVCSFCTDIPTVE